MQDITLSMPDDWFVVLMCVVALFIVGRFIVTLYQEYQMGKSPTKILETGVIDLVSNLEQSPLDEWIERQIMDGKLPEPLLQVVEFVKDAVNPMSSTTTNEALKAIGKFVNDTTDGDLST
jgi:hypothetical protein